jgi:hypothetical protein
LTTRLQRVFPCNFFSSCFSFRCLHSGIEFLVVYGQYVVTASAMLLLSASLPQLFAKSNGDVLVLEVNMFSDRISWFCFHLYSCIHISRQVKPFQLNCTIVKFYPVKFYKTKMCDKTVQSRNHPLLFLVTF